MSEQFDGEFYEVDFNRIIEDRKFRSVVRTLALDIQAGDYITTGEFFRCMSTNDVDWLCEIADVGDEHEDMEEAMALAIMLSVAEGLDLPADEEKGAETMQYRLSAFLTLAVVESLSRKGLVKVHHQNFSLGEDVSNLKIAEKLDDIDYDQLADDLGDIADDEG